MALLGGAWLLLLIVELLRGATPPAYASVNHSFEKVGDHWERKDHKGASDPRSTKSTAENRRGEGDTYGGVDYYGHTKEELYDRARKGDELRGASRRRGDPMTLFSATATIVLPYRVLTNSSPCRRSSPPGRHRPDAAERFGTRRALGPRWPVV